MPVITPPIAAIRQNQASARTNALLSAFTTWASPCPTSCSSARGATAAQMSPAATPSTALPARAAANAASRPFVGPPYGRSAPARSYPSAPVRLDGVHLGQNRRAAPAVGSSLALKQCHGLFSPVYRGESGGRSDTSRRSLCRPEQ